MDLQKSGHGDAHSVHGAEPSPSRSPLRKRSLSLRRLRSPPFQANGASSVKGTPVSSREVQSEPVPPLPASTSAYGRLEGGGLGGGGAMSHAAPRRSLAALRQTATAPSSTKQPFPDRDRDLDSDPALPPVWPEEIKYQRCYCEEGSYLLAAQLEEELEARRLEGGGQGEGETRQWEWEVWVVVVSNRDRTVLLWHQKASKSPELNHAVLWDYHVFVVVSRRRVTDQGRDSAHTTAPEHVTGAQYASSPPHPSSHSLAAPLPPRQARSLFGRSKETGTNGAQSGLQHTRLQDLIPDWSAWVYDIDSCLCSEPDVPFTSSTLRPVPFEAYTSKTFAYSPGVYPAEYLPMFRLARAGAFLDNFASDRSHMLSPGSSSGIGGGAKEAQGLAYSAPVPPWPVIIGPRARRRGWTNNLMEKWVNMDDAQQRALKEGGVEWQNQSEELKVQFGKVMLREEFFAGRWKMAMWRRRTGEERAEVYLPHASPSKAGIRSSNELSKSPPIEARRGGRVSSPLFPAYMAASLQARAARPRESYLALRATDGKVTQLWPDVDGRQQTEGGGL
ncbi:hypothetical protein BCV69DRAFT_314011 [Microstroma glucosiphilum]|uniref:Protein N-terminal glutamine amidohydrolase n=1 Tax=Pseudomicrostroma glucosiphilum TaxID=1684307 RepID=A0A316U1M1_9BASI|nr:hypothetical protein BCV69DRAFT_314011 [Pseudomicrostroma glucosiphilum]PWN19272.1 hypothetical protein BCV69DRAFT_314011 [Pseudomicrostroma glucosiphilum]